LSHAADGSVPWLGYIPGMPVPLPAWNRSPEPFAELISAEAIATRVAELGAQITRDYAAYAGANIFIIGVLKGSVIFLADLVRHVAAPVLVDFIGISSYGDATVSSGVVQITQDLSRPIEGKHVIVVEDIVDTGLTLNYLLNVLRARGPRTLKVATLLSKPSRRLVETPVDYIGFTIEDHFVVGYGLDYNEKYRNLRDIVVYGA